MCLCISTLIVTGGTFLWKRPGDFHTIETPWSFSFICSIICGLPPYSAYIISHFNQGTNLWDAHECICLHHREGFTQLL